MTDISSKCTVLINSCDKYEEAWGPFFSLFNKFWPECPFEKIVNTETKSCKINGVNTVNATGNWGERLSSALSQIDTPYVIFMLEDFFLQKPVREKEIFDKLDVLDNNPDIACFYFNRITEYTDVSSSFPGYYEMIPKSDESLYILNCQASLWRKDVLLAAAKNSENPWQFEVEGYKLNKELIDTHKFYCLSDTRYDAIRDSDVFSYILERELGYGIWNSKWLWNNKKLFNKNKITYSFDDLGVMSRLDFELNKNETGKLYKINKKIKKVFHLK